MVYILYVRESTSGEYVGKCYEVKLTQKPLEINDGEASFSPNHIEISADGLTVYAWNDHFRVACDVVGTKE